ncbi:MAG TPA: histidine kinase [Caulobacteraceae bacterium]|nr:histidine kinase [Caulobacteraceae bacterium]
MSLRLRILLAFVLVLASGSCVGLALAGLEARQWLRDELWTAQLNAHLQVARDFADLPNAQRPARSMAGLVATFSGNRHLQAVVTDPDGKVIAASEPAPAGPAAPGWFASVMRPDIPPTRLAIPGAGGAAVELRPLYADDTAETWAVFLDIALVLTLAMVGGGVAVFALVTWALRPLTAVGSVLPRIGAGDYAARAPEAGPPEIVALGRGVNEMAARLATMRERTRALEEQILTLQDEERADIARDLHDEIGPHLFAANVDATMAAALISGGKADEALAPVRRAGVAIGHIQRLVRDILGRLRPTHLAELGLSTAVLDLVAFWSARRPDIDFETELPGEEDHLPEAVQEPLYRLVQESLSNAVRHGAPTRVRIGIRRAGDMAEAEVVNDGAPEAAAGAPGYGLTGMAERVAAAGGTLAAGPAGDGHWRVAARLPLKPVGKATARDEAA